MADCVRVIPPDEHLNYYVCFTGRRPNSIPAQGNALGYGLSPCPGPTARFISLDREPDSTSHAATFFWRALILPQSLSFVLVHIIFSTKDRASIIPKALQPELHAFLATVARNVKCECYRAGGVADHIHLAVRLARTIEIADLIEELKTSSSKWIKTKSPQLRNFAWQSGYAAFSLSPLDRDNLVRYIERQEEHHRKVTFQEEYRRYLKAYGIDFDERYVWD